MVYEANDLQILARMIINVLKNKFKQQVQIKNNKSKQSFFFFYYRGILFITK